MIFKAFMCFERPVAVEPFESQRVDISLAVFAPVIDISDNLKDQIMLRWINSLSSSLIILLIYLGNPSKNYHNFLHQFHVDLLEQ